MAKNSNSKEKNVNSSPDGNDFRDLKKKQIMKRTLYSALYDYAPLTPYDYAIDQTLSGVCYSWPRAEPKVFVRAMGASWYWVIPGHAWSDGDAGYGLYDYPIAALVDGRVYFLNKVWKMGKDTNE